MLLARADIILMRNPFLPEAVKIVPLGALL